MKVAFVSFYDNYVPGARMLAASLKRAGHDCRFIHLKAMYIHLFPRSEPQRYSALRREYPYVSVSTYAEGDILTPTPVPVTPREEEILLEDLGRDRPDVLGLCAQWSTAPILTRIAALVRRSYPGIRIVAGGPPVILCPGYFAPHGDAVCVGEGEEAVAEWLEDLDRTDVSGLWFRRNGTTIENPRRPVIADLDELPYPLYGEDEVIIEEDGISRKLETDPLYLRDKWIPNSTRGCPMNCTYCVETRYKELIPGAKQARRRSVDHFLGEIREMTRRLPFDFIEFHDSIFVRDENWLAEFAEKYRREIGIPFRCNAYPGVSTPRMLELIKAAGGKEVAVDVQSGSARTLNDVYRRPTPIETVRRTVFDAMEAGFGLVSCDLIMHSPHDTEDDLRKTFEFLMSIPRPLFLFVGHLIPYPGTKIAEIPPPRESLPVDIQRFWAVLCLLTQFGGIRRRGLAAVSRDSRIRARPEILDAFLVGYVRRLKYTGRNPRLRYSQGDPSRETVGRWPRVRLFFQERSPYLFVRAMLWKRKVREFLAERGGRGQVSI